jgi:predicted HAD superfamily Cof-like phosphohydrolase
MNTIQLVRSFMETAGQEVKSEPGQPSVEVLKLRLALELEELYEKAQAFGLEGTMQKMMAHITQKASPGHFYAEDTEEYNPVAVLDACADQRVVADGTILACGLEGVFEEAMNIVHASNMSKFCEDMNTAGQTSIHYQAQGIDTRWFAQGGKWVVVRASDQKILKSIHYTPADLAPLFRETSHV